jgi:hypothetical protein
MLVAQGQERRNKAAGIKITMDYSNIGSSSHSIERAWGEGGDGRKEPSRASLVALFIVGALLLAGPLLLVVGWAPSSTSPRYCSSLFSSFCKNKELYQTSAEVLPYVMLVGGAVIAYGIRRVANSVSLDSKQPDDDIGEHEEEDYYDEGDLFRDKGKRILKNLANGGCFPTRAERNLIEVTVKGEKWCLNHF